MGEKEKTFELQVPCNITGQVVSDTQDNLREKGREVILQVNLQVGSDTDLPEDPTAPTAGARSYERKFFATKPLSGTPEEVDDKLAVYDEADSADVISELFDKRPTVAGDRSRKTLLTSMQDCADYVLYSLGIGLGTGVGGTLLANEALGEQQSPAAFIGGCGLVGFGLTSAALIVRSTRKIKKDHTEAVYDLRAAGRREAIMALVQGEVKRTVDQRDGATQTHDTESSGANEY